MTEKDWIDRVQRNFAFHQFVVETRIVASSFPQAIGLKAAAFAPRAAVPQGGLR